MTTLNARYFYSALALYSLKAYCSCYEKHIHVEEFTINHREEFVLHRLFEVKSDILCLSCYIWNTELILSLVRTVKKVLPDTIVILGGPEVSFGYEDILLRYPVDAVVIGEGEETFLELLRHYIDGVGGLEEIRGIAFAYGGEIIHTGERRPIDMCGLPFAYGGMLNGSGGGVPEDYSRKIFYYEAVRGCPYNCAYCMSSENKGLRALPIRRVYDDLQAFLDAGVKQVKFVDRTFNCQREYAMDIWRYIERHDNGFTGFHFELRADILDQEMMMFIGSVRSGLFQFEIGVQSVNDETLRGISRVSDTRLLRKNIEILRGFRNVHLHLDLIAGLPYEGYGSFRESFNYVFSLRPDMLQLGFLKLLKGTKLREDAGKYGIIYRDLPPYEVLYTDWLSFGEIVKLKEIEEMVELFYNSQRFSYTIKYLLPAFDTPFDMFERLAEFFYSRGYHMAQHSKHKLYEIMKGFMEEYAEESLAINLLRFDLFAKENEKGVPDWMYTKYSDEMKKRVRSFYGNGRKLDGFFTEGEVVGKRSGASRIEIFDYNIPMWAESGYAALERESCSVLFIYGDDARYHVVDI